MGCCTVDWRGVAWPRGVRNPPSSSSGGDKMAVFFPSKSSAARRSAGGVHGSLNGEPSHAFPLDERVGGGGALPLPGELC